jgi:peptidoglycan hydrolase-like protein with peptidoglycan-binding domain
MRLFERPGDPEGTLPERLKFAQKALVAANNNPSPAPVPDIPPVKQTKRDPIKLGDRGTLVQMIQLALGGVKSDAIYGRNTQAAVAAFQKQKRIEPTGIVDKTTWGKLFAWPKTPKNKEEKT